MYIIDEGKQVGVLYHFTEPTRLKSILGNKGLKSFREYISFTRNFNLQKQSIYLKDSTIRLAFDGNKLSEKFKIEPFLDDVNGGRGSGEYEERIVWPRSKILPCLFALKQIVVLEKDRYQVEKLNINFPLYFVDSFKPYR